MHGAVFVGRIQSHHFGIIIRRTGSVSFRDDAYLNGYDRFPLMFEMGKVLGVFDCVHISCNIICLT